MSISKKPNILVIMADQLAAPALSLYGNKVCKTPNLERLASQGTVFENAYCNNPLCVPSRASMMSGLLSPKIDVYDNANELASSVPTMAHYLRNQGYWTELCGKMHFIGPDQLHGFNDRKVTDVYPANFQWIADWNAGAAFVPSGTALNGVVEAGPCIRSMQEDYDDEVEHTGIQNLYDFARNPKNEPFFQLISFTNPHTPFVVSREYWDRYSEDEIDPPTVGEIPFEELDYHSKALFFAHGRHRHRITTDHLRTARHAYYGMISYVDDKVGRILDVLEKTGLRDNTAIFFVSDHGEMMGERGMWFKQSFWEWSARVPFIASIPGQKGGERCSKVTSLVDLVPTMLALAGCEETALKELGLDGNSLLPVITKENTRWPDTAICDYLAIGPCAPCRMVRKGDYKYIYTHLHPAMLFNLVQDPNELNDVSADPQLADILAELHAIAMDNWDPEALTQKVLESQRRRKLISKVPGETAQWDYIARKGDESRYVRGEGVDNTKGRLRLPFVPAASSDWPALSAEVVKELIDGKRSIKDILT